MPENARNKILQRLQNAGRKRAIQRPVLPPLREERLTAAQRKERFIELFAAQGGVAYPVVDREALWDRLAAICQVEGITRVMATEDDVLSPLDLAGWGQRNGVVVHTLSGFPNRKDYTRAVFDQVQAGVTGVNFAVAESGTLILGHDRHQARLVSLAPLVHVAVVPAVRIVGTYDTAMQALFAGGRRPSQVSFITGPSMTADIQATMFKGMHGPQKLFALVLG